MLTNLNFLHFSLFVYLSICTILKNEQNIKKVREIQITQFSYIFSA